MLEYVDKIYCVDADSSVKTEDKRIELLNVGVGHRLGTEKFIKFGNGTGNYFYNGEPLPEVHEAENVQVWTLEMINAWFGVYSWDLIKCDIEGAEVGLLMGLTKPPADQITFELHLHTPAGCRTNVAKLLDHLKQWYEIKFIDYSEKHGCGLNVWDCLAVIKK